MSVLSFFRKRARSFGHAWDGIRNLLGSQIHARFHLVATVAVVAAAFFFRVSSVEWCVLIVAMTLVWVAEAFNTALEHLADAVSPEIHPLVKKAKDVAAGAVLLAAIGAAILGALVFWPYLAEWTSRCIR